MSFKLLNPARIRIKKIWSESGEILEAERVIDDEDSIEQIAEVLDKAAPFNGFYPIKLETPGFAVTFYDEGEQKGLSVEGDYLVYDDGEEKELPENQWLLADLLNSFFTGSEEITRTNVKEAFAKMAS